MEWSHRLALPRAERGNGRQAKVPVVGLVVAGEGSAVCRAGVASGQSPIEPLRRMPIRGCFPRGNTHTGPLLPRKVEPNRSGLGSQCRAAAVAGARSSVPAPGVLFGHIVRGIAVAQLPGDAGLLTPREAAVLLAVTYKTINRWALTGKIAFVLTPGGHRRYRETDVMAIRAGHHVRPLDLTSRVPSPRSGAAPRPVPQSLDSSETAAAAALVTGRRRHRPTRAPTGSPRTKLIAPSPKSRSSAGRTRAGRGSGRTERRTSAARSTSSSGAASPDSVEDSGLASELVELRGFEPLTFSMRTRRATNCATAPMRP